MSTYINIKWEKKRYVYTCTSCKLGDIYTNAYIHLCAYVRVCIHSMYICIPARCPRNRASDEGLPDSGGCAFFGKSYIFVDEEIFPSSDPKWPKPACICVIARSTTRIYCPETRKERHRSEINFLRSFAPALGAFLFQRYLQMLRL